MSERETRADIEADLEVARGTFRDRFRALQETCNHTRLLWWNGRYLSGSHAESGILICSLCGLEEAGPVYGSSPSSRTPLGLCVEDRWNWREVDLHTACAARLPQGFKP